jgi:hypothetical protein
MVAYLASPISVISKRCSRRASALGTCVSAISPGRTNLKRPGLGIRRSHLRLKKQPTRQINLASNVIAALRTFETGQFFSASLAI